MGNRFIASIADDGNIQLNITKQVNRALLQTAHLKRKGKREKPPQHTDCDDNDEPIQWTHGDTNKNIITIKNCLFHHPIITAAFNNITQNWGMFYIHIQRTAQGRRKSTGIDF